MGTIKQFTSLVPDRAVVETIRPWAEVLLAARPASNTSTLGSG
jgi:hypothetical protein